MSPPPTEFIGKTNTMITDAVNAISAGKNGAFTVWVDTKEGVNAAFAQKVGSNVKIVAYAGKRWGEPLRAGVASRVEW